MDIITKRQLALPPVLTSPNTQLRNVESFTFLDIILSADLKWNKHIGYIVSKASKRVFIIRNLRKAGCPPELIIRCYTALIRSVLTYAYASYCNLPDFLFTKLLRVERRVLRSVGSMHSTLDLPSFVDRTCSKLFSSISHHEVHPLRAMFAPSHARSTRTSSVFRPPFAKTTRFSRSFIKFASRPPV